MESAEAAYVRCGKTATVHSTKAAVHSTKAATKASKPRLRRNRHQGGAHDCGCHESNEFIVDHGSPHLLGQQPPFGHLMRC
jgi:hypothetical protein